MVFSYLISHVWLSFFANLFVVCFFQEDRPSGPRPGAGPAGTAAPAAPAPNAPRP
jgi:hypothetical protein